MSEKQTSRLFPKLSNPFVSLERTAIKNRIKLRKTEGHNKTIKDLRPSTTRKKGLTSSVGQTSIKPRSLRLRDPKFAAKHRAFLHKVSVATNAPLDAYLKQESSSSSVGGIITSMTDTTGNETGIKRKLGSHSTTTSGFTSSPNSGSKRRRNNRTTSSGLDGENDCYCWICHKEGDVICCETCPRVFHLKCIQLDEAPTEDWVCPECVLIMTSENMDTRSRAMRLLTVDQLSVLLKYAVMRMRTTSGIEPFLRPVDAVEFPAYKDYITCPIDLMTIERNVRKRHYGSTEAFLADTKWIIHNCIVFNSPASKLSLVAKTLLKICSHEMHEIENCPDCYLNAHTKKDSWFVSACRIPHLLVWAKLKGFPFWPGKAMRVNTDDLVDVRFFGAHERAWIPVKEVFLYSSEPPISVKNKKRGGNLDSCVTEVEMYIRNLSERFGIFHYADHRTPFDPKKEQEHIKLMFPECTLPFDLGPIPPRVRSNSLSGSDVSRTASPVGNDTTVLSEEKKDSVEGELEQDKQEDSVIVKNVDIEDQNQEEDLQEPAPEIKDNESDRAAASPPCEVSSTTVMGTEAKKAQESEESKENSSATVTRVAVINETSEKIIIEEDESLEVQEMVEIDDFEDVEEIDDDVEEIDDVEPEPEIEGENDDEIFENVQLEENESPSDMVIAEEVPKVDVPEDVRLSPVVEGVEDDDEEYEEIDDVEPDGQKEVDDDQENQKEKSLESSKSIDTTNRLIAAGVSVTMVDKKVVDTVGDQTDKSEDPDVEPKNPEEGALTIVEKEDKNEDESVANNEMALNCDISVTVVQKKKTADVVPTVHATPKISVKKESDLLAHDHLRRQPNINMIAASTQEPNIVAASTVTSKARKTFPRKSQGLENDSGETAKFTPPDPIVTICKVNSSSADKVEIPTAPVPPSLHNNKMSQVPLATMLRVSSASQSVPYRGAPPMRTTSTRSGPGLLRMAPGCRGPSMPALQPRPCGPLSTPPPIPNTAGPVTTQLNRVASKLVDFMQTSLEDFFRELSAQGSPEATIKALQLEMEKMQWRHQQELAEVKHNSELILVELRQSMESERQKFISDLKRQADIEKQKIISETKKKQWCANCGKEAIFYCCWNTSYCDYPCQQAHWPNHMSTCAQNASGGDDNTNEVTPPTASHHHILDPSTTLTDHNPAHYLQAPHQSSRSRIHGNGIPSHSVQPRGLQGGPLLMPYGPVPTPALNTRAIMTQMGMRFVPPRSGGGGPVHPMHPSQLRFPPNYFISH